MSSRPAWAVHLDLVSNTTTTKIDLVTQAWGVHTWDLSIQEVEAGGLKVQNRTWLHSEF